MEGTITKQSINRSFLKILSSTWKLYMEGMIIKQYQSQRPWNYYGAYIWKERLPSNGSVAASLIHFSVPTYGKNDYQATVQSQLPRNNNRPYIWKERLPSRVSIAASLDHHLPPSRPVWISLLWAALEKTTSKSLLCSMLHAKSTYALLLGPTLDHPPNLKSNS